MRQFMLGIPDELIDAARVDGAGELRIFARVVMPLCRPALATLAILTFLGVLEQLPVAAGGRPAPRTSTPCPSRWRLYAVGQNATEYGLLLAGAMVVVVPVLVVFFALQQHFVQGIATTGIKS